MALSTALSSAGGVYNGVQGKRSYNFKADQASLDANAERGAGRVRAARTRRAGAIAEGEMRAGYGASGIDVNTGAPMVAGEVLHRQVEEDALNQLLTGERKARALEQQAELDKYAGKNALIGGFLGAGGSALSGTANYLDYQTGRDKWIRRGQMDFQRQRQAEFSAGGGFGDGEF